VSRHSSNGGISTAWLLLQLDQRVVEQKTPLGLPALEVDGPGEVETVEDIVKPHVHRRELPLDGDILIEAQGPEVEWGKILLPTVRGGFFGPCGRAE